MIANDLLEREVRFRNLFWHFMWPEVGKGKVASGCGEREESWRDRGAVLEKMVMGSAYEGEERGKYERRQEWNGYWEEEGTPHWLIALLQ